MISHAKKRCGIHEYGVNIFQALKDSEKYSFHYFECASVDDFASAVATSNPSVIIYNYAPITLPWLNRNTLKKFDVPHVAIIHEGAQEYAKTIDTSIFHYYIFPDPTLLLLNSRIFKTGRLVPQYTNTYPVPHVPVIGSFGFGLEGKGFDRLISMVQNEFDEAIIRLHIPFNDVVDPEGIQAKETGQICQSLINKPGIKLQLSHEFLTNEQVLDFLAKNTLNAFFYRDYRGRGVSSVIDYCLAVQRPVAITKTDMFRHITSASPSICIEETSLRQIISNGFSPLSLYYREWSKTNFVWDYERILDQVLSRPLPARISPFQLAVKKFKRNFATYSIGGDKLMLAKPSESKTAPSRKESNEAIQYVAGVSVFNRILDNAAREQYAPAIEGLMHLVPELMSRKIPEANIQQAFVFDTVRKFSKKYKNPSILCVGSYEDTAYTGLKALGFIMDEIDPVLNYDLNTFMNKPTTRSGSYDIVYSTSVLEHVQNDELFLSQVGELLSPGGVAILTCDYNDRYQPGDRIPSEDFRFYTQNDFKQRLLPLIKGCSLVDLPQWDCQNPDFSYGGCTYTFATLVFQKNK